MWRGLHVKKKKACSCSDIITKIHNGHLVFHNMFGAAVATPPKLQHKLADMSCRTSFLLYMSLNQSIASILAKSVTGHGDVGLVVGRARHLAIVTRSAGYQV